MAAEPLTDRAPHTDRTYAHVAPAVLPFVERGDDERIRAIRAGSWIPYPRATQILKRLKYVLEQPAMPRMTGLTLSGPTNNGKTTLIHEFIRQNNLVAPVSESESDLIYVETPSSPNQSQLYTKLLRAVGDIRAGSGTLAQKAARVWHVYPQRKPSIRMIFIDEIHNLLAGSGRQTEAFLNCLKELSNALRVPMVLVGTENALRVIETDPQVHSRFPPAELPRWQVDANFTKLTSTVLQTFPLRRPSAVTAAGVQRLYKMSNGRLGDLVQILQRAAAHAITEKVESIDANVIDAIAAEFEQAI